MSITPTPEQQRIIDHPLTPLRVTAGAGTGKTTTMAMRLASKVVAGEVAADRTLGITFTNKAARELAESIRTRIGAAIDPGLEVEVTTYHGFAFGVVREFGPLVGIPRSVRIVTPGYVRQLLRDAVGAQTRTHVDLTQVGRVVDRLLSLSSSLGDHLLRPGDLTRPGGALAADRAEIGAILEDFDGRKADLGVVDYADLVTAAHRIVTEHPEVAERIRGRYDLVLLDEYQDTNPGQRELLLALFGDGFPVTAVGDSDQTIYEWRGASPQNFEEFPRHFRMADGREAPSLDLSTSWRSGPEIVQAANLVRAHISRPGPLPELLARTAAPESVIRTHWAHSAIAEAGWIAAEVTRLHDEEGRAWRDIALLFRKHRQMATIRDAMVAAGIPVEVASLGGLLQVPEVAELHAWLRILGRPDDAPALARLLLGSRYRLGLGDLAPLARWVKARRPADEEVSIGWALLEAVDALETVSGLTDEATRRLTRFRSEYRDMLETAQGVSLVELCRRILDRTGAWPEIDALPDAARVSARLNTFRFLDLAEDWSPLEGGPSLDAFLDHLDVLSDDGSAEELDTARVSGEDAVAMLTVHRAKGLEWPVVFLPALTGGTFPSQVLRYEDPMFDATILPHELRLDRDALPRLGDDREANKVALGAVHADGEWRTAYVAVTRAAEELVASGAWWYTAGRAKQRSELFDVLDTVGVAEPGRSEVAGDPPEALRLRVDAGRGPDPHFPDGPIGFLAASLADPEVPSRLAAERGISAQYDAAVDQLRIELDGLPAPLDPPPSDDRFRTSVTGLVTFAGCPLRFRWEHVDHLPRRPSAAARRGIALHRKIELHHRGTVAFDDASADFYDDVDDGGVAPTESAYDRFQTSRFAEARPILIETPFELTVGDAAINGRIDAVYEHTPGEWEIVDFKSGRRREDPARRVQLEAYAVASDEAGLDGRPPPTTTRVTFAYFGGDTVEEVTESVDTEWLAQARDHLRELVGTAATGPYEPSPGDGCRWCDFARFCDAGTAWLRDNA